MIIIAQGNYLIDFTSKFIFYEKISHKTWVYVIFFTYFAEND